MSERVVATEASAAASSWRVMLLDACAVLTLGLLALSPLADIFVGQLWLIAGLGGLLIGVCCAATTHIARLGPWTTAALAFLIYVFGGLILAGGPGSPIADARGLMRGVVGTWRDVVTAAAPLASHDVHQFLAMPLLAGVLTGLGAGLFSWRSRWPQLASLVVVIAFVISAAFGWRAGTGVALGRGLILFSGLLIWSRMRDLRHVRIAWGRRIVLTFAVLAVALAAGATTGLATSRFSPHRDVVREAVKPPFDIRDFPSPLSALREFRRVTAGHGPNDRRNRVIFKVEPAVGRGRYIPAATLDTFDGVVWNVTGDSGAFLQPPSAHRGTAYTVTLTEHYPLRWIPAPGMAGSIRSESGLACPDVRFNALTGTGVDTCDPRGVRRYAEIVVSRRNPPAAEIERGTAPSTAPKSPAEIPESLASVVDRWMDALPVGNAGQMVSALAEKFRNEGRRSDGERQGERDIRAGHGLHRLDHMVVQAAGGRLVGNSEQFASALAIVVEKQFNLPARVVFGFKTSRPDGYVVGKDATAWTEVLLHIGGRDRWVAFQPTPLRPPRIENPNDKGKLQTILAPPNVPGEPTDDEQRAPRGGGDHHGFDLWGLLLAVFGVAVAGVKLSLWTSPLWGIVLYKILRRRRRREHEDPVTRVSGGWREITDRARDLGTRLQPGNTRYENSMRLAESFPESRAASLGAVADRHVFGPVAPTDDEVQKYWEDVDSALGRMRDALPWWKRPLVWFSPLSIPWGEHANAAVQIARERLVRLGTNSRIQKTVRRLLSLRRFGSRRRLGGKPLSSFSAESKDLKKQADNMGVDG